VQLSWAGAVLGVADGDSAVGEVRHFDVFAAGAVAEAGPSPLRLGLGLVGHVMSPAAFSIIARDRAGLARNGPAGPGRTDRVMYAAARAVMSSVRWRIRSRVAPAPSTVTNRSRRCRRPARSPHRAPRCDRPRCSPGAVPGWSTFTGPTGTFRQRTDPTKPRTDLDTRLDLPLPEDHRNRTRTALTRHNTPNLNTRAQRAIPHSRRATPRSVS